MAVEHAKSENSKENRVNVKLRDNKEILEMMPLLKPIRCNLLSGGNFNFKWYAINVFRRRRGSQRFYLNMTRYPSQLPKVLASTMQILHRSHWHTFFLLIPSHEFMYWRIRFPMLPINVLTNPTAWAKNSGNPEYRRKKLKAHLHPSRRSRGQP